MTVDDKLKWWRESTEAIAPPAALMASLAAQVDAAPAAPPSTGAGTTVVTAVKTVVVMVFIAVTAWAFLPARVVNAWREGGAARTPSARATVVEQCPPRPPAPQAVYAAPIPAIPREVWETEQRKRIAELRKTIAARPMTCEGQKQPITEVLVLLGAPDDERERLFTRYVVLCGLSGAPPLRVTAPGEPADPMPTCDASDWCHFPKCGDAQTEACAREYAARPEGSCFAMAGRMRLAHFACERFVRGQSPESEVKALSADAWCLTPQSRAEVERLSRAQPVRPAP